jgi:hypothetical protein
MYLFVYIHNTKKLIVIFSLDVGVYARELIDVDKVYQDRIG